jgi:hypothetical protein
VAPVLMGTGKGDREWRLYQLLCQHYVPWRYVPLLLSCREFPLTNGCFSRPFLEAPSQQIAEWYPDMFNSGSGVCRRPVTLSRQWAEAVRQGSPEHPAAHGKPRPIAELRSLLCRNRLSGANRLAYCSDGSNMGIDGMPAGAIGAGSPSKAASAAAGRGTNKVEDCEEAVRELAALGLPWPLEYEEKLLEHAHRLLGTGGASGDAHVTAVGPRETASARQGNAVKESKPGRKKATSKSDSVAVKGAAMRREKWNHGEPDEQVPQAVDGSPAGFVLANSRAVNGVTAAGTLCTGVQDASVGAVATT